jgi:hypothetical protein
MLQFYLLSILLNCVAGFILISNKTPQAENESLETKTPELFKDKTFKLVIGIMCCFSALVKLLTSFPGAVPILGDLIPSVAGLLGGASLLIEYYITQSPSEAKLNPKLETIFIANKKYIGILCILSALLHFLFPKVILL